MVQATIEPGQDSVRSPTRSDIVYMPKPCLPDIATTRPPSLEQYIKERFGLPADWRAHSWHAHGNIQTGHVDVEGGVFKHVKISGKYKGDIDYRKPEPGTSMKLSVRNEEHASWVTKWEEETGLCSQCFNTGWEIAGWDHKLGTGYWSCKKCKRVGDRKPEDTSTADSLNQNSSVIPIDSGGEE